MPMDPGVLPAMDPGLLPMLTGSPEVFLPPHVLVAEALEEELEEADEAQQPEAKEEATEMGIARSKGVGVFVAEALQKHKQMGTQEDKQMGTPNKSDFSQKWA